MSDACCAADAPTPRSEQELASTPPWYRRGVIQVPLLAGVLLLGGVVTERVGSTAWATALTLVSLILGASMFVPGALKRLVTRRSIGVGLLMTISAIGAVLLGYYEEAAALAFLYSFVEGLEGVAMQHARTGLRSLLTLVPETVTRVVDGAHETVVSRELETGDRLLLRAGERLATDATVVSGQGSVDASAVTGESIPVAVEPGSELRAGVLNGNAVLELVATAPATDNSLTTIVSLVEQAQKDQGAKARLADRIAAPLVPGVLILAALVALIGPITGDTTLWLTRALVVLVAASPCAMAIAVPVTVVSAVGAASRFGVVIRGGAAFERFGALKRLAFDKTGTLTNNRPEIVSITVDDRASVDDVLGWAAALETHSGHPLAAAIVRAAEEAGGPGMAATDIREQPGQGVSGFVNGAQTFVGNPRLVSLTAALESALSEAEQLGQTCVVVAREGHAVGLIALRDELRDEAAEAVAELAALGCDVAMLTGDNRRTAEALAAQAGIRVVYAELTPEAKADHIREMAAEEPTGMVGDGINDAPALATATVGIAMGAHGTDAAIESAEIAFMGHDLRLIAHALSHAQRASRIMKQNIALSLAIIVTLIPLAVFGVLGLASVVLIHELAEVLVIANGLRAARERSGASD